MRYIPEEWKEERVMLIPKAEDYNLVSHRFITLYLDIGSVFNNVKITSKLHILNYLGIAQRNTCWTGIMLK